jgi:hypothetical protein
MGETFFSVRYEIFEKSGPSLSKMWEELNRPRSFFIFSRKENVWDDGDQNGLSIIIL